MYVCMYTSHVHTASLDVYTILICEAKKAPRHGFLSAYTHIHTHIHIHIHSVTMHVHKQAGTRTSPRTRRWLRTILSQLWALSTLRCRSRAPRWPGCVYVESCAHLLEAVCLCVCVCVFVCLYIYIYTYIHTFMYIHGWIVYKSVRICLKTATHIHIYTYVYTHIYMYV